MTLAKIETEAMRRYNKKNLNKDGKKKVSTPGREAWKRLKRNRLAMVGMVILIVLILLAIFAPVISQYDPSYQDWLAINQTPSKQHICGTDNFGRDIFTRLMYGTRISLSIGLVCVCISVVLGGTFGALAAFYGGKLEELIMRFMDIYQSIPNMLLAIAIAAALGTGMGNLILAISLGTVPLYARVVRGAILTVRSKDYIEASQSIGAGTARLILKHMIPNALGPIVVQMTFSVAASILTVSSLSYIGLGIAPPTPEWGSMLNAGKQFMQSYPHIILYPGLMIMITVLALNLFGDGLRDALDPRLK